MVSASTLIGPFEFDRALATRPLLTARSLVNNGRVASARSNSNGPIRVEAETILWSEVWPAMDGVVGLPIISVTAFRITSLNGVRMARNSAKETSSSQI